MSSISDQAKAAENSTGESIGIQVSMTPRSTPVGGVLVVQVVRGSRGQTFKPSGSHLDEKGARTLQGKSCQCQLLEGFHKILLKFIISIIKLFPVIFNQDFS